GFTWRNPPLLENLRLAIDSGERIGLLGRNGAGKSTLMKLLAGDLVPDHGEVRRAPQLKVARLIQEVPQQASGKVVEVVAAGLPQEGTDHAESDTHIAWRHEAMIH
ncbi:MAG: ATP-binding cassette domain-containing protein, partial [Pirellulaceae bacterium]